MKKLIIIGVVLIGLVVAFTALLKHDAPKVVKAAFAKKFPNVSKVTWDKENISEWEGEFKMDGIAYSVNYEDNGTWKETEHEITISSLPHNLRSQIEKQFPNDNITEVELSVTPDGTFYEIMLGEGDLGTEIIANKSGDILSQNKIKEDID
ncbi:PepSY-like domain-containing protein [Gaetbulibacter aestuarii]|uniref:PepSY-like domain-containing protein n=1 Tax=Gaetbulibacter aestuarii TaxID=1502358 RepID=A0ABW7N1B8_9FLAO